MSSIDEYSSRDSRAVDELFLERLETFMDKCLADIRAFSERELRPFEETRRSVAEWHAKYLFHPSLSRGSAQTSLNGHDYVRSVLVDTSRVLESLAETAGVQSFILSIEPGSENDGGFLGGSLTGREFWRTVRGGGDHGAKAFKQYCLNNDFEASAPREKVLTAGSTKQETGKTSSKSVKADLYETARKALKTASGIRTAEMKWTNHERLDLYGVRLVGWPPNIPAQNPSTLKVSQNKQLLDAFKARTARFERLPTFLNPAAPLAEVEVENDDFSWAYDPNASPMISSGTPMIMKPGSLTSAASTRECTPASQPTLRGTPVDSWEDDGRYMKRPRSEFEGLQ